MRRPGESGTVSRQRRSVSTKAAAAAGTTINGRPISPTSNKPAEAGSGPSKPAVSQGMPPATATPPQAEEQGRKSELPIKPSAETSPRARNASGAQRPALTSQSGVSSSGRLIDAKIVSPTAMTIPSSHHPANEGFFVALTYVSSVQVFHTAGTSTLIGKNKSRKHSPRPNRAFDCLRCPWVMEESLRRFEFGDGRLVESALRANLGEQLQRKHAPRNPYGLARQAASTATEAKAMWTHRRLPARPSGSLSACASRTRRGFHRPDRRPGCTARARTDRAS